ncbi:MAG: lipopolysaccharide biosynthesis protein [bacterium]|nr:lipopolysaccharide biosynthesis protein [bacterium]
MADQKPPHSFAERFIRTNLLGRFWSSASGAVGLGTSFFTLTALSIHQFGLYQLSLSALALSNTFSVNFFDDVVQNDVSRALSDGKKETAKKLFHELAVLKIGLGIVLAFAFFFFADVVAAKYDKDIGVYIRIISFVVAIRAAQSATGLFLNAVVSLRAIGASAIEEISKLSLISGFFFFSTLSIERVLFSTLIAAGIALVYVSIAFCKEYRAFFYGVSASKEFQFKRVLFLYGPWTLMRSAVKKVAKPLQPWLIATLLSAEAVALYTLAANLVTMVKGLFPDISPSLLAWEINNESRLRYIFSRGLKYTFLYGSVLAVGSLFFVPPLVGFLFPKYLPAMPLFLFFLISVPIHGIQDFEMAILTALREQKVLAARLFVEVSMTIGSLVILAPFIGLMAAGVGVVAPIVWRVWYLHRQIVKKYPEFRPDIGVFLRFDQDDRLLAMRAFAEAKSFARTYAPARWLRMNRSDSMDKKV